MHATRGARMNPTDEELLHAFYAGDNEAVKSLAVRHDPLLWEVAFLILRARTGSVARALGEWDVNERVNGAWTHVLMTRLASIGSWPHQRLSALTWLIHILCLEMDRHVDLRGPF
jgi:hypothetical protein